MAARDIEAGRAHVLLSIRDRLTQGLKLAEKKMRQFGRYVATSAGIISGGTFGGIAWPLKLSSDMEQATVSMEVFLGSADAAKKLIADIETMAAKTPFQFDELKDSAVLLMGFGATGEQVLPMLRMLGDVSGGNSERFQRLALAFGQVMAKGRLMGQEVMQMTEQGFNPLSELSKITGKSMKTLMKEMENGLISFPMVVRAFQSATGAGGRFNGMMDKQSATLGGLFSTLVDYVKIAARAFGDTLVPLFKSLASRAIGLAKGVAAIVKANAGLIGGIAKLVLAVGAIAGVFAGIGVFAMGVSFVFGLMASGLSAIATVLAVIFSPMGVLIGVLGALAGAAIYFRSAIYEAFTGLLIWVSPVTDAFGRIYLAGTGAIQGIIDAISTGNIQLAGTIAVAALKAMFWQAASEIPGAGVVMATSYGRAILAGRWDLAAAIALTKVKLVLLKGWNAIANIWTAAITGLGAMWDIVVHSITTVWRNAVYGIASSILWVMQKLKMTTAEAQAQLADMKKADQKQSDRDFEKSMAGRAAAEQKAIGERRSRESALAGELEDLQSQAAKAQAESGIMSLEDKAAAARAELEKALSAATEEKAKQSEGKLPKNLVPGLKAASDLPNVESRGTFSAAAAMLFGNRSDANEQTARNTALSAKLLRQIADKRGPAFV